MVRNSVRFVPYQDRKAVSAGLKTIYLAPSAELAADALEEFAAVWDAKYPVISKSWRSRWNEVIPFFKFSRRNQESGVYDRRGRVGQLHDSKSHQTPAVFSE
jgi:transposase-like protein